MSSQYFCYVHAGEDTPLMMPLDAGSRAEAMLLAQELLAERPHATHAELWDGDVTALIERPPSRR